MAKSKKIEQDTIQNAIGPFSNRMKSKEVKLGDTVFVLEALKASLVSYIGNESMKVQDGRYRQDQHILRFLYIRFGIKDIVNAHDIDGAKLEFEKEKCTIDGIDYETYGNDMIDALPPEVTTMLFVEIEALTHLTDGEIKKLNFTMPSIGKG